jgi:hypothetical protein
LIAIIFSNPELPFSPSRLDPVEYKQETSPPLPADRRSNQRDTVTTDIDVPIHVSKF